MAFKIVAPQVAGLTPIANTDAGVSTVGGTTIPSPPATPGMIVRAVDGTLGEAEFILLKGVASTAVGSCVIYDSTTFATTLAPAGTNLPRAVAFAMSASNTTTLWGWYQISGQAAAKKTCGVAIGALAAVGVKTTGLIAATGTGKEVQGALAIAVSTNLTSVKLMIDRPHMQGRIT